MPTLKERWNSFANLVLDPWIIVLILVTLSMYYFSGQAVASSDNNAVNAFLRLVLAISAGVLGGVVARRWETAAEEEVIVARGKVAIRSLIGLFGSITQLRHRVDLLLERQSSEGEYKKVTRYLIQHWLEEVIKDCVNLQNQALSSIDNWQDLIPQADVEGQVERVAGLALEQARLIKELGALQAELDETKSRSAEEQADLRRRLKNAVRELNESRKRTLSQDPLGVGSTVLSSVSPPSGSAVPGLFYSSSEAGPQPGVGYPGIPWGNQEIPLWPFSSAKAPDEAEEDDKSETKEDEAEKKPKRRRRKR